MENKFLLELEIKYGLDDNQVSKIADVLYQMGISEIGDQRSQKFVAYMLEHNMIEMPIEDILDHFRTDSKKAQKPEENTDSAPAQ